MDQIEYTPDEIMENIKDEVEKLEKNLIEYETQLKNFDENVEKLKKELENVETFLN
jgi:archaellum component FlaC